MVCRRDHHQRPAGTFISHLLNIELLGKGYDGNIMKLIRKQREMMLKAVEELE